MQFVNKIVTVRSFQNAHLKNFQFFNSLNWYCRLKQK